MNIEKLLDLVKSYNGEEVNYVKEVYDYAKKLHEGQYRQSGEPYIIHPLSVAYILAEMHADRDTICAGLLHDTIEDTPITKEDIIAKYNQTIANLVEGVTKISKMNFSSKDEERLANTRKIITSITCDVRIIIIKLADRLHNMRTLEYKSEFKQKENALETMEIYVPLAYYLGAYQIKNELEDLSLRYLYPNEYQKYEQIRKKIAIDNIGYLEEMASRIKSILNANGINSEIKIRIKNIYGIYSKLNSGEKLYDIHDLLAIKVMVDDIGNCYRALGLIHKLYHPINSKFKDYICNPKTNMYSSLHTTVFGLDDKIIQIQIRTHEMDKVDSFGLTTYWDINKGEARNKMQNDLKERFQFFKSLIEINSTFSDNLEFVNQVKKELFKDRIYVYTPTGDIIELPRGATAIDFAYKIHTDIGNTMVGAIVNDEYVEPSYQLKNKDIVRIITDSLTYGSKEEWLDKVVTAHAKKKIKEFKRR